MSFYKGTNERDQHSILLWLLSDLFVDTDNTVSPCLFLAYCNYTCVVHVTQHRGSTSIKHGLCMAVIPWSFAQPSSRPASAALVLPNDARGKLITSAYLENCIPVS